MLFLYYKNGIIKTCQMIYCHYSLNLLISTDAIVGVMYFLST